MGRAGTTFLATGFSPSRRIPPSGGKCHVCVPRAFPHFGVGSSSNMHAFSSMFVHFPLDPAWLCLRCCRKWSARKNFLLLLHSLNLWSVIRCWARSSQSWSDAARPTPPDDAGPVRAKSRPQYPQVSASPGRLVLSWKAWL